MLKIKQRVGHLLPENGFCPSSAFRSEDQEKLPGATIGRVVQDGVTYFPNLNLPHQLLGSLRPAALCRRDPSCLRLGSIRGQLCLRTHLSSGRRAWSPWGHQASGFLSTAAFLRLSRPGVSLSQQLLTSTPISMAALLFLLSSNRFTLFCIQSSGETLLSSQDANIRGRDFYTARARPLRTACATKLEKTRVFEN